MTVNPNTLSLETKRASLILEDVEIDGSFSGYASLFGEVDLGNDIVDAGAFASSLKVRSSSGIRMLWQHDAAEPIGVWTTIREEPRGLYVEGRLAKGVARAREALELMRSRALDGLSVGFRTVRARKDAKTGARHIVEADLWEISVVTFPMMPKARIESVKSDRLPTIRQFENWLTRDARLSRAQARTVIAKGYAELAQMQEGKAGRDAAFSSQIFNQHSSLAERIRAATYQLKPRG